MKNSLNRLRTATALGLMAAVLGLRPAPLMAQVTNTYAVIVLSTNVSQARAIDDNNVVGGNFGNGPFPKTPTLHILRWQATTGAKDLGTAGYSGWATAVNSAGAMAGQGSSTSNGDGAAWSVALSATKLKALARFTGGSDANANGINASGVVVGYGDKSSGCGVWNCVENPCYAMAWVGTNAHQVPDLGGYCSIANGINDSGAICGAAATATNADVFHAFLNPSTNGVAQDLGTLGGSNSFAAAINSSGQIVGEADLPGSTNQHAVLWTGGVPQDLGTLPGGTNSGANAIDAGGDVIGWSDSKQVIWPAGGGPVDLDTLVPADSGWTIWSVNGINSSGIIAGSASNQVYGTEVAVLIVPRVVAPKSVMVAYQPWFEGPYTLGAGNWGPHWTGNGIVDYNSTNPFIYYDPNITNSDGQVQIASHFYPLIGPYDSQDPVVLEYHTLLMKLAGIDGAIADWYGSDNYYDYLSNDEGSLALFNAMRKAGLKFSLCYESSTIAAEISGGCQNGICVTSNTAVSHAQQTMLYAQDNYFYDPAYFRLNGQPLLLTFGNPTYFVTSTNWQDVFALLADTNQPAFFTEDARIAPVALGSFDWPPMFLSTPEGESNVLSDAAMQGYLGGFNTNGQTWPASVSSAFPRFYDIYPEIGAPQTNDSYLSDNDGLTFQETLRQAMTNSSVIAQVVTWNDFGEGTIVEPTTQYGYRDLGVIQDYRRQYLDPTFPYTTNDLTIPLRLYNLRREYAGNTVINAELNRAFTNAAYGSLPIADLQLTAIESTNLVLYDLSVNRNGLLQFSIGGALPQGSATVEATTNLTGGNWQSVATLPAGTDLPTFSTNVFSSGTPMFFRVQSGP